MAILYIGLDRILCGGCGGSAYAFATAHIIVPPADIHGRLEEGCGAAFTEVSCIEHCDWAKEWASEHRRDLEWIEPQ